LRYTNVLIIIIIITHQTLNKECLRATVHCFPSNHHSLVNNTTTNITEMINHSIFVNMTMATDHKPTGTKQLHNYMLLTGLKILKLELKMFHQTYTACKRPLACTAVTPSPPGCNAMVSSAAACSIWHMAHSLTCIVNGDDSAVFRSFVPGDLTCKLVQARDQTQQGTKHVCTVNLAQICSMVPEIFDYFYP